MNRHYFAVNHDIDRFAEIKLDPARSPLPDKGMVDMRTIVAFGEVSDEIEAVGRPANDINLSIPDISAWSKHHLPPREPAVIEDQQGSGWRIRFRLTINLECVDAFVKVREAEYHCQAIASRSQTLEAAVGKGTDIGDESQAEDINVENMPCAMA